MGGKIKEKEPNADLRTMIRKAKTTTAQVAKAMKITEKLLNSWLDDPEMKTYQRGGVELALQEMGSNLAKLRKPKKEKTCEPVMDIETAVAYRDLARGYIGRTASTYSQIAQQLGVDVRTFHSWFRKCRITLERLQQIAKAVDHLEAERKKQLNKEVVNADN